MLEIQTFIASHGDNFALEGAFADVPETLVDRERSQSVVSRILVGLGDNPSRGVRNSLINVEL